LDDAIIHATIVQQITPEDDDSSVYHIFERLNTGGTKLQPQEIRSSIYHGEFVELLGHLNDYEPWRNVYGSKSRRAKDQELILRFLALHFWGYKYQKPLNEFLNKFTNLHRHLSHSSSPNFSEIFQTTIDVINKTIGNAAFRSQRVINAAVFDSMMVGVASRLERGPIQDLERIRVIHDDLIKREDYTNLYTGSTTDERNVAERLAITKQAFKDLP
jgi:hypothetical protein